VTSRASARASESSREPGGMWTSQSLGYRARIVSRPCAPCAPRFPVAFVPGVGAQHAAPLLPSPPPPGPFGAGRGVESSGIAMGGATERCSVESSTRLESGRLRWISSADSNSPPSASGKNANLVPIATVHSPTHVPGP